MSLKQVIVVRKDLNMRKGKIGAQCAHASMKVFFDRMNHQGYWSEYPLNQKFFCSFTPEMMTWMEEKFTKVVVSCNSEEELRGLQEVANAMGIPNALIVDSGLTEFGGVPTTTCLAIGPDDSKKIDLITGELPLL